MGLFFVGFVVFGSLYFIEKNKRKIKTVEYDEIFKKNQNLKITIDNIQNDLSSGRKGYYVETIRFSTKSNDKNTDNYVVNVFVSEKEKYTNGMSKIKFESAEVISGFSRNIYDEAISCARQKFSTIIKTTDIIWLELEIPLKEQRINKINKLLEKIKEKEDGTEK